MNNFQVQIERLQQRMQEPLPGIAAQRTLFSGKGLIDYETRLKRAVEADPATVRQSSVLILLYEQEGHVFFPVIKRPEYEGVHSGQIALPGGKAEPNDRDLVATALREAQEEIGVLSHEVVTLGMLTPVFIPPSRFWVNVVLGYAQTAPSFIPDAREVEKIIPVPLLYLQQSPYIEEREVIRNTEWSMKAPGYVYEEHFIWGATSMILTELRALLKDVNF